MIACVSTPFADHAASFRQASPIEKTSLPVVPFAVTAKSMDELKTMTAGLTGSPTATGKVTTNDCTSPSLLCEVDFCVLSADTRQSLSDRKQCPSYSADSDLHSTPPTCVGDQDRLLEISDSRGRARQVVVRAVATGAESWHNRADRPNQG